MRATPKMRPAVIGRLSPRTRQKWPNVSAANRTAAVGTPIDPDNLIKHSFVSLLERGELPRVRFHDFRHAFATILLGQGTHPKIVQEMLGHANISQTMDTYSHVMPAEERGV